MARQVGRRVVVVGSGGGKTSLAARLSGWMEVPHVELDALYWEPDWAEANIEVFRGRIERALSGDSWVVDGSYSKVRDLVWPRAETIIWLDYPLRIVLWRTLKRAIRRIRSGEELWPSKNRETFRNVFLSRNSVIWWKAKSYHRRRRTFAELFEGEWSHLQMIRLRSPADTESFVEGLLAAAGRAP